MKATSASVLLICLAAVTASASVWILKQQNTILWQGTVNAWLKHWTSETK